MCIGNYSGTFTGTGKTTWLTGMQGKNKHRPVRTCVGCGRTGYKDSLLRIVRSEPGELQADLARTLPGRGVYLCFAASCLHQAVRRNSFVRYLATAPSEQFIARLGSMLHAAT